MWERMADNPVVNDMITDKANDLPDLRGLFNRVYLGKEVEPRQLKEGETPDAAQVYSCCVQRASFHFFGMKDKCQQACTLCSCAAPESTSDVRQ